MSFSIKYFYMLPIATLCSFTFVATSGCGVAQDPDADNANIAPVVHPLIPGAAKGSSGERGNIVINEIGYAGSICTKNGKDLYDPDDVFIEFQNKHFRRINFSGWRLDISGDYNRSFVIPETSKDVPTNGYFVIAAKKDGAFPNADLYLPGLKLGKNFIKITLRDIGNKLINSAGSTSEDVFAGGYDRITTRSMEFTTIIFGNDGSLARNWHTYSDNDNSANLYPNNIAPECRKRTLASPGEGNSSDYSGNSNSGGFD